MRVYGIMQIYAALREGEKPLHKEFRMEEVINNKNLLFVGRGFLQDTRVECKSQHVLSNHIYVTPKHFHLMDAVAFAFITSLTYA